VAIDPFSDPRYAKITLRTDCPRCGAHLPVNGPVTEVECGECGQQQAVDPALFRWLLEQFEGRFPDVVRATRTDGDLTWRATADPSQEPPCPACDGTLALVGDDGAACGACGALATVAEAPSWGLGADRVLVPLSGPGDERGQAPVALNCPSCGAGLQIDGEAPRLTTCEHCGSQVHLPELVWRTFHPKRTVTPWIVRVVGESRPARAARQSEREREQQAEKRARDAERMKARAIHEARQAEKNAAAAAEAAERKAAEALVAAAAARRWALLTAPLVVISALVALSALGAMALGLGVDVVHLATLRWRGWRQYGLAAEAVPFAVVGYVLGAWALCVVLAAIRGKSGGAAVFWSAVMMGFAHIPVVGWLLGLYWAWEHARDREPTTEIDGKLPFLTGAPLALLYATVPAYDLFVLVFLAEW
jgi:hypothetical protein